jgi:hypothetical protein
MRYPNESNEKKFKLITSASSTRERLTISHSTPFFKRNVIYLFFVFDPKRTRVTLSDKSLSFLFPLPSPTAGHRSPRTPSTADDEPPHFRRRASKSPNFKTPTHCQNPSSLSPNDDETHRFYLSISFIFLASKLRDVVEQLLGLLINESTQSWVLHIFHFS